LPKLKLKMVSYTYLDSKQFIMGNLKIKSGAGRVPFLTRAANASKPLPITF